MKKILFIGNLNEYTESYSKYVAFKNLGYEVIGLSTELIPHFPGITENRSFIEKVLNKFGFYFDKYNINQKIIQLDNYYNFDLVWSDKALLIKPETLLNFKRVQSKKLVFASGDNMAVKNFRGAYWDKTFKIYDYHITMKSYIIDELKKIGCKEVIYVPKSYDKHWMKSLDDISYQYDVTFVGSYEKERAESLKYLAENSIRVDVWGNGWDSIDNIKNLTIHKRPLYKEEMIKVVNSSKINMCFLRKLAKDLHTNRTFEIPVMGGFMIAERTHEHLEFFEEDEEAVYFDNNEELLQKVKFYLKNELEREKIKNNGYQRCINSGYSYEERYKKILKDLL